MYRSIVVNSVHCTFKVSQQLGAYVYLINSNNVLLGRKSNMTSYPIGSSHSLSDEQLKSEDDIRLTLSTRKKRDWPRLSTISKSGFTLEVGPLPWGSAVSDLYLKTKKFVWQLFDAVEARNRAIENRSNGDNVSVDAKYEIISTTTTFFQAAECKPVDYPRSPNQTDKNGLFNIEAMIHPNFQGMDYLQELTNETKIFIGLDGVKEYKFDKNVMTEGEDEEVRNQKDFYPFFINESAYYEKGTAFFLSFKEEKQVPIAIKKQKNV